MQITLNGQLYQLNKPTSVKELLEELRIDVRKIAVEHNLVVVPIDEYNTTHILGGDILEIVQFIGGG